MRKIAIISESTKYEYSLERLKEEATKLGFQADHIMYSSLIYIFEEGNTKFLTNGENLLDKYDYFILRSALNEDGTFYGFHASFLSKFLTLNGKRVLNSTFMKNDNYYSKLSNYALLSLNDVPIVRTFNCMNVTQLREIKDELKFPVITKIARGSHGKGIELFNTFEDLRDSFNQEKIINKYLIQEYISDQSDSKSDFRVITLGTEVIGAYKKVAKKGSIVTNLGAGGDAAPSELTPDLLNISKKVIDTLEIEFSGIDIIYKDNKPYVLEVNKAPQFEGFEKATGINLAEKIINKLISNDK